jgi:pyridoxal phosphate enzyme (YggS family)
LGDRLRPDGELIEHNVERVMERIARAALKAGRKPEEVRLVAVTKGVPLQVAEVAVRAGITDLGENRVQEGETKRQALSSSCGGVRWHLIGHLQTNKAGRAARTFDLVHSIDSLRAAEALSAGVARARDGPLDVLVQVNVSGEESKYGLTSDRTEPFLREVGGLDGIRVRGLMTIAPLVYDPEDTRPVFRRLAELARTLEGARLRGVSMDILSMGMTQDFEVAISEGANLVRIGTAIFGPRSG